ncbi:MAG: SWIM zinc finger family protein [Clostridia bacterium]
MLDTEKLEKEIQEHFEDIVIERGKEYFRKHHVKEVFKIQNTYIGVVEGTYTYKVKIKIKDGLIYSNTCTCPCMDTCKHVVAALIYIAQNEKNILPDHEKEAEIRKSIADVKKAFLAVSYKKLQTVLLEKILESPAIYAAFKDDLNLPRKILRPVDTINSLDYDFTTHFSRYEEDDDFDDEYYDEDDDYEDYDSPRL